MGGGGGGGSGGGDSDRTDAMATPSDMRMRRAPPKGPRPKGPPPLAEAKQLNPLDLQAGMPRSLESLAPPKKLGALRPLGAIGGGGGADGGRGAGREESEVVHDATEIISGIEVTLTITQISSCVFIKAVDADKGEEFHSSVNLERSYIDSHCDCPDERAALYQKLVERCCFKSGGARNKQKKGEKMRRELYIKRGALFEDAPARDLEALGEPFVEDRRTIGNTSASVRAYIEGKRRVHVRFSDPVERDIGDAWVEIPYECTAYFADRRRQETLHTPAVDSPQIQGLDAVDHICSMVTLLEKELNLQQVLIAKQSPTLKLEIEEALRLYRISQAIKIQCCVRIRQACAELQRRQRERERRRQLSAVAIQSQARRVAGKKRVMWRRARVLKQKQERAATRIQAVARRISARRRVESRRLRWNSTRVIQATGRGMIVRERRRRALRDASALKIQGCARQRQARQRVLRRREEIKAANAATQIQGIARKRQAAQRVGIVRAQNHAAVVVQRHARGLLGRRKAARKAHEKEVREAEERARQEALEKVRLEAEEKARKEAEEEAQKEAEERARIEAEEQAKREAEAKAAHEEKIRKYNEEKAKKDAERRRKREAEDQARRDQEALVRQQREEEEAKRRQEEEEARRQAEEAEAVRRAEEEAAAAAEEERARVEAEVAAAAAAKAAAEAAAAEAEAEARLKAEAEAAEAARLQIEEEEKEASVRRPVSPKLSFSGQLPPEEPEGPPDDHDGWHETQDEDGNVYYYNEHTGESSWDCPWDDAGAGTADQRSQADIDAEVERRVQERLAQLGHEEEYAETADSYQGGGGGGGGEGGEEVMDSLVGEVPSEDVQRAFQYVRHGRINEIENELTEGLDVHVRDESNKTLLHVAAANNHRKIVKLLHSFGADLDAQDFDGNSPLHLACQYNYEKIVKLLKKCKADETITNKAGFNATAWGSYCNEGGGGDDPPGG
jgi:hypothetical protein